jgi:hypothetical protein
METQPVPLERHPDYWLEDGSVVFQVSFRSLAKIDMLTVVTWTFKQVERVLYRIHLSILQKLSPVFRDIFSIPQITLGRAIQGSEENPILLERTKRDEFDDFLLWIYRT